MVDHYTDRFWNDLSPVLAHLCRHATGDPDLWWMDYFKRRYALPPKRRALIIGCGNGWVERDLYDRGVAEHFEAFDGSERYLAEAEANKGDRSIHYFKGDFDTVQPRGKFDLIVNVAALHHVRRLYDFVGRLANALETHGVFVNWDYVGPSRNQYSSDHLAIMERVNTQLPLRFRTPYTLRPGLKGMLVGDSSEAIHSGDIMQAVGHCFDFVENRSLGGGVAYQILWNNLGEFEKNDSKAQRVLEKLLQQDEQYTQTGQVPNLFSFFVCKKRTAKRPITHWYHRFFREPAREVFARAAGGCYPKELPMLLWRELPKSRIHRRQKPD